MSTSKPFRGSIYVKGHFEFPECRAEFARNPQSQLTFTVPFGTCGMAKRKEINTSMTFSTVIIVKFHSQFLTKYDKAYDIGCHFDRSPRNVTSSVAVTDLEVKPMMHDTAPNECDYSLRANTLEGPLVQKINLGETIVHRWQCKDTDQKILVKNCIAKGSSDETRVIDERGCPISEDFTELTYSSEASMAFVALDAFRFPDNDLIKFECQLEFCSADACVGVTPPNCPKIYPSEFHPNSMILENEDGHHETQIYGVFDQPFRTTTPSVWTPRAPSSESKPAFPLPEVQQGQPLGWDRRKDQPLLFTEVKAAHQQTNDGYLLLKKERKTEPSSPTPNTRPRRDEGRVRNVRSETILIGNYTHSFMEPNLKSSEVCWARKEAVTFIYIAAVLAIYGVVVTIYLTCDFIRGRARSRKALISGY
ncbi:unnamed protein product [Bursaphelenchus xylophilus]|uniref:(pine wood nematode) hypothetical protein n=1 Tax=Bursaphelenchus xylophilus TaxID=6326 RepID=A0A811K2Q6_BURXY|nr:unnamed protein product [Bursaphelenchus xylophilus]CAG9084471.1 unnamed protein product [Bursaphelenchus xylophilus]